jgi:hypothetical protein
VTRVGFGMTADSKGNVWFLEKVMPTGIGASTPSLQIGEVTPSGVAPH